MRRTALASVLIASLASLPLLAVSRPEITGGVSGVELCPQSICGVAAFAGNFVGQVKSRPVSGVFWAGIKHDPLPEEGQTANITGGTWLIRTRTNTFAGVIEDGTLLNNGNNGQPNPTYTVTLTMAITSGGTGTLAFTGILDHNPFPPTIVGTISQN